MGIRGLRCGVVAALAVLSVAGCGSSAGRSSSAPTSTASPKETVYFEQSYSPPPSGPAAYTPEEKINTLAAAHGWTVDKEYTDPAAFVQDMCDSLPGRVDPEQWIVENQQPTAAEKQVLTAGIPLLCPRWTKVVKSAIAGKFSWSYEDGTYRVGRHASAEVIAPGTYRTTDPDNDCYWERTTAGGDVIDNQFATSAQRITVTIAVSDGQFTSESCGTWRAVH